MIKTNSISLQRDLSIDLLRGIAAIMVVLLHSTMGIDRMDISNDFIIMVWINGLTRWTVPVFVMISGAFLLSKDITYKNLFYRIIHLCIILFLWNVLYFILMNKSIPRTLSDLYLPSCYHLWFLYMLIGVYAMIPLLRAIVKQNKELYLIIFWTVGNVCIKTLGMNFTGELFHITIFDYCGYFILGHYIYTHRTTKDKYYKYILIIGILSFLFMNILTTLKSIESGKLISHYFENLNIFVCMQSILVFTLFTRIRIKTEMFQHLSSLLSKVSLGVYLIHPLILVIVHMLFKLPDATFNSLVSWTATVIISIAISYIILKIPYLSRLIK